MNFTFGIITVKGNEDRINIIIDSIENISILEEKPKTAEHNYIIVWDQT